MIVFATLKGYYKGFLTKIFTPYWKLYHEITWDNIKKFLPKKKNTLILDAGGGTGYWAIKLAKIGYKVILTDISEEMLKVAKRKIKKEKGIYGEEDIVLVFVDFENKGENERPDFYILTVKYWKKLFENELVSTCKVEKGEVKIRICQLGKMDVKVWV